MATIDEVRHGIQVLVENIAASEAQLEELKRQKNEDGRSNEAKKDIGDEIAFIRSNILEDKRRIVAEVRKEAAEIEAGKGETPRSKPFYRQNVSCTFFFNGMHSTFPLRSVCYRISLPQLCLQLFGRPSRHSPACSSAGPSSSQPATPDSPTPCLCSSTSLRPASPSRTDLLASSSTRYTASGLEMRPVRTTEGKELKML